MSNKKLKKIDLTQSTSPIREDRLGTVKAFAGKVSDLVKGKHVGGDLAWRENKFQQTAGCLLTQTIGRLVTIRDSSLIIHGPVGCSQGTNDYREIYQGIPGKYKLWKKDFELHALSSNLTEGDIVFGGEKKLRLAIKESIARYNPKAIIIACSCASGVMGDDIDGIVASIQPEVEPILVPVHCEGFRSQISQSAFDGSSHAIARYIVQKPKKRQKDLVGVIAPMSVTLGDKIDLVRMFNKIGLRARFIPDFATVDELKEISEAAVIAPTCQSYGEYLQRALYENYDTPYFTDPAPLGIENTKIWFRNIAKYTGKEKEVEQLIKEELDFVTPKLEELKKLFKGKEASIYVSAGQARAVFIPKFATELGIDVAAVNTLELSPEIVDEFEEVYKEIGDFEIHASDYQPFEQSHLLNRLKPDLYTGCIFMGLYKREGSHVRNHSFLSDFSPQANQFFFRGILNYGHILKRALNNPSLNKTLHKKTPSPYKSWWYEQDDIEAYIKQKAYSKEKSI
ncbi:nitrogenase component 1 [Clostridium sp. HV4-5-A1G]|uniref:nitrogenase component 1 n=1 Tax=Clostridium sp. HV4-5-A1G TaxID=2004595 RepID=UPI00123BB83D|nr:nitrogenase component 1 [Clostridium sp. HV4-5-A1G]KAA8673360.1 nitrogenase [Clostridium sp. HV4-5-A1G]